MLPLVGAEANVLARANKFATMSPIRTAGPKPNHSGPRRSEKPVQVRKNTQEEANSMNFKNATIAAAIGSLLAVGVAQANHHEGAEKEKVKCFGVAKAGKNDCATASHSCAGAAKTDNDPTEWQMMPKADCEKAGGKPSDDKKTM